MNIINLMELLSIPATQLKVSFTKFNIHKFWMYKGKNVVFPRYLKPNLTINVTELQKSLSSGQKNFAKNHAISLFQY